MEREDPRIEFHICYEEFRLVFVEHIFSWED